MNYFEPYASKSKGHEDQLTRAYLIVLRYCPAALLSFYDTVRESCCELAAKKSVKVKLPPTSQMAFSEIELNTQTSTLSRESVNQVLSVLLTDREFSPESPVSPSPRNARYDGIIVFGDELAIIIENKPHQGDVWEGQLSPSEKDLPEGSTLIEFPAIVEWKAIVRSLSDICRMTSLGGAERMIIEDFLSFVDSNFSYLNPFDQLSLCGSDGYLVKSRIHKLLESIAASSEIVIYHRGWQNWCIETGLQEIRLVGVTCDVTEDGSYNLNIRLYFGDTLSQARAFYRRNILYDQFDQYSHGGWRIEPNFHVSFIQTHLLRLFSPPDVSIDYYNYWSTHQDLIKQYGKVELLELITTLKEKQLIIIDQSVSSDIKNKIANTNRKTFNICPSIGLIYRIPSQEAVELDNNNKLVKELHKRIRQGLRLVECDVVKILAASI